MASRLFRRLSPAVRVSAGSKYRTSPQVFARKRNLTSSQVSGKKSSGDTPWIIGSGLVFGPALIYLVFGSSRKKAPHHGPHNNSDHTNPAHTIEKEASETPVSDESTETDDSTQSSTDDESTTATVSDEDPPVIIAEGDGSEHPESTYSETEQTSQLSPAEPVDDDTPK